MTLAAVGLRRFGWPVGVVGLYGAAWCFALRGWFGQFGSALAGDAGGDGSLTAWQLLWPSVRLEGPLAVDWQTPAPAYLDGNVFAGLQGGGAYAFSDMMPGWLPVVSMLRLLTANPVLIVNLVHLFSLWLLPLAVYHLARSFRARPAEALAAGSIAVFTAYQFDMLLHLQLQFLFAPVFALSFQLRGLRENPRPFYLAGWWLALAWTLWVSPHLFLFGAVAAFLLLPIAGRRPFAAWKSAFRMSVRKPGLWAAALLAGALVIAGAWPYRSTGASYGFERLKTEAYYGGARLEDFSRAGGPHEKNLRNHPLALFLFLLALFRRRSRGRGGFPRTLLTAAVVALLFWTATERARAGPLAILAADALLLWLLVVLVRYAYRVWRALGERIAGSAGGGGAPAGKGVAFAPLWLACFFWLAAFGPLPVFHNVELPLVNPYNLLYEFVPGFDRIRASVRIVCLFWIFFGPGAARGLRLLWIALAAAARRQWNSSAARVLAGIGVCLPVVLIYWDALPADWSPKKNFAARTELRALHRRFVHSRPREPVLIVAPRAANPESTEAASLFFSLDTGLRLVGGLTGVRVEPYVVLRSAVAAFLKKEDGWTGEQIDALLAAAGVGSLFAKSEPGPAGAYRELPFPVSFDRGNRPGAGPAAQVPVPACSHALGGRWRLSREMYRRQALLVGHRPAGAFCVGTYGLYRDRFLTLQWEGPVRFRSELRFSTPFYYHPAAPETLYAAAAPGRRGSYTVTLSENSQELFRQAVTVK